jgi:hypothetical protein
VLHGDEMKLSAILVMASGFGFGGCGGAPAPAQNASDLPAQSSVGSEAGPPEGAAVRPTISAQACESNGGSVVGDIGDGAIHRPEYRCANGAKPTASIGTPDGGPIAIEGSVCCPR